MRLLDSSVVVARSNERDSLHSKSLEIDFSNCAINELVFSESANVISRSSKDYSKARFVIESVYKNTPIEFLCSEDLAEAMRLFSKYLSRLSFTDCALIAQSKRLGAQIISFDEDLVNIAKYVK